jgi:hypothetical protein
MRASRRRRQIGSETPRLGCPLLEFKGGGGRCPTSVRAGVCGRCGAIAWMRLVDEVLLVRGNEVWISR